MEEENVSIDDSKSGTLDNYHAKRRHIFVLVTINSLKFNGQLKLFTFQNIMYVLYSEF